MSSTDCKAFTIVVVTDTLCDANGVSRFLQDMASEAAKKKKNLYIITNSRKNRCRKQHNISVLPPKFYIRMPFYQELDLVFPDISKTYAFLREKDPDIVHISVPGPIGIAGYIWAKRHKKIISGTYHTNFPAYMYSNTGLRLFEKATTALMRRFYRDFAVVFSRSDAYANVLQRDIGIERERIRTIPYGTKLSSFSPSFEDDSVWHQYKEVRESSAKVLYVGRLSVEKNFPFLVDLWRSFRRGLGQNIDAQLVAVGEGDFLEQRDAWLRDDIVLLGYKKGIELSTLYASSQLFLFPSLTDTLGQTVMEAQASGLPVICSDAGGPKNIVTDQKSGFVLPIDHLQWMRSLFLLLSSDGLCRSMGRYAHAMMKERDISLSFESFWEEQIGCIE